MLKYDVVLTNKLFNTQKQKIIIIKNSKTLFKK